MLVVNRHFLQRAENRQCNTQGKKERPSSKIVLFFKSAFGRYLWLTNTITSGILMTAADTIQQEFEFQKQLLAQRYDFERTGICFMLLDHRLVTDEKRHLLSFL